MKITKIRDVKTPSRGTPGSAGLDFYIPNDHDWQDLMVYPNQSINIPSGIKAAIPPGHALIAFNKSGVAINKSLQVGACVIDEDYQSEIHLHLVNTGTEMQKLMPGNKILQFVLVPVCYPEIEEVPVDELYTETTKRGEGGFGSTGA